MKNLSLPFALCLASLAPAGCRKGPAAEAPETVVLRKREEAQRRAEALLQGLDKKLSDLRGLGESSARNAKSDVRETMASLEEKKMKLQLKLEELKTSSKDAAKDLAEGLDGAADDLERSYKDAARRFK